MKRAKQPTMSPEEAQRRASAWGQWMRANVEREIASGRLQRLDPAPEPVTIH